MKRSRTRHKEPNDQTPSSFFEKERESSFFDKGNKPFFNSGTHAQASSQPVIQRKCAECEKEEAIQTKQDVVQRDMDETVGTATTTTAAGLIVEDDTQPQPGQMARSQFLGSLRQQIFATATEELAGTPFSVGIASSIDNAMAPYYGYSASNLEQSIKQREPSGNGAQTAGQLIQIVNARVLSEIRTSVPSVGGVVDNAMNAASSAVGGIGSAIGSMLFKENAGGAKATHSPAGVMQSLGKGSRLDSHSQNTMQSVFGKSFSNVEIHTDSKASQLSRDMNARAFTVGNHIAFSSGEHKPGTLIGDALMAHELAHVMQQQGFKEDDAQSNSMGYAQYEEDADNSAVSAILSMKGIKGGIKDIGKHLLPKLKTGLKLQRCPTSGPEVRVRYRRYGQTGFGDSCPKYCACTHDETGAVVTLSDPTHTPRKSAVEIDGRCPPGIIVVRRGMAIISETGLPNEPCTSSESMSGCM